MVGVDAIRHIALQSKQHSLVCAVTASGMAQRAEQFQLEFSDLFDQAVALDCPREQAGRPHRAHRVGTGWPYADLEQVENADGHAESPVGWSGRGLCNGEPVVATW